MDAPSMTDEARAAAAAAQRVDRGTSRRDPRRTRYGYAASLALADATRRTGRHRTSWRGCGPTRPGAWARTSRRGSRGRRVDARRPRASTAAPDWRGAPGPARGPLRPGPGAALAGPGRDAREQAALLDARAAGADLLRAHAGRRRRLAAARGPIRDALRAWQFDAAQRLMADARTVLAQRNAGRRHGGARRRHAAGVDARACSRRARMAEASAQAEAERAALIAIERAAAARSADDDLLSRDRDARRAPGGRTSPRRRLALAAGDIDAAPAAAERAAARLDRRLAGGPPAALLALAVARDRRRAGLGRRRQPAPLAPRPGAGPRRRAARGPPSAVVGPTADDGARVRLTGAMRSERRRRDPRPAAGRRRGPRARRRARRRSVPAALVAGRRPRRGRHRDHDRHALPRGSRGRPGARRGRHHARSTASPTP